MHCCACDKPLVAAEIYIDERTGQFEELCRTCKEIAYAAASLYLSDEKAMALSRKAARQYARAFHNLENRDVT